MTGRTTDDNGKPLLVRDSRIASTIFGLGNPTFTQVPKSKFLFYTIFYKKSSVGTPLSNTSQNAAGDISTIINSFMNTTPTTQYIGLVAKTVDRPKVKFTTELLNQYNKKRLIQTKHEFEPLSMKFHDTVDNRVFNMFQDYYKYYYGDAWNTDSVSWMNDVVAEQLRPTGGSLFGGSWGYTPPSTSILGNAAQSTYYFDRIEIYQLFGGKYNLLTLVNPKIVSFDPDELNYDDEKGINEITLSIQYEGLIINNKNATIPDSLKEEMGVNFSDPYDIASPYSNLSSDLTALTSAMQVSSTFTTPSQVTPVGSSTTTQQPFTVGGNVSGTFSNSTNNTGTISDFGGNNGPLSSQIAAV